MDCFASLAMTMEASSCRRVGKGAFLAVPTNFAAAMVGTLRFAHPTMQPYFFTNGHREASSGWNASLPGIVASSL